MIMFRLAATALLCLTATSTPHLIAIAIVPAGETNMNAIAHCARAGNRSNGAATKKPCKWAHCIQVEKREGFTRAIHGPRPSGGFAVLIGSPADQSNRGFSSSPHLSAR